MNYYNPYYYQMPNEFSNNKVGLFSRFRNINFNNIINNTGKVLQIANQAIPLVKQVTPVVRNAKTMFKVLNEFKKSDNIPNKVTTVSTSSNVNNYDYNTNGPTFFA